MEVNVETDFVARNEEFLKFVGDVTKQIIINNPADVETLLKEKLYNNDSITIGDMLTEKIAKIGENMNIRRFARFEGIIEGYIHGGGRIGVLVKFETDDAVAQKQEFKILQKI